MNHFAVPLKLTQHWKPTRFQYKIKMSLKKKKKKELWGWRRSLRVLWMARRSNQSILKGNQLWIFTGRIVAEAEAPILGHLMQRWFTGKDSDAREDWGQEEKGATEDEMVGWRHWLSGHKFEQTLGDSEEQRRLVCYSPWGSRLGHDLVTEQ